MRTFVYLVWFSLPVFFFLMALWAKLEQTTGSAKKHRPGDLVRQGMFVSICVGISILIDQYLLETIAESIDPVLIPLGAYQTLTLPLVLFIAARIAGPSETIRIVKAPRSTYKSPKR